MTYIPLHVIMKWQESPLYWDIITLACSAAAKEKTLLKIPLGK